MNEMFSQALMLMAAGMGTVFFFLIVMVVTMHISARILKNSNVEPPTGSKSISGQNDLTEIAIAVAAAVRRNG